MVGNIGILSRGVGMKEDWLVKVINKWLDNFIKDGRTVYTDKLAQAIRAEIKRQLDDEVQICSHNSIPCYYDGADEGCFTCMKNQAIKIIKGRLL